MTFVSILQEWNLMLQRWKSNQSRGDKFGMWKFIEITTIQESDDYTREWQLMMRIPIEKEYPNGLKSPVIKVFDYGD